MRWNYIAASFTSLIIAAYMDNIRGPLLPVLSRELSLTYATASWFVVAGNFSAVLTNFLLVPTMRRFHEIPVTLGICLAALAAALLAVVTKQFALLIVLAMLLGSSIAALGVVCNLLIFEGTSTEMRSRFLCGLHTMYGFGSLVAPGIAGLMLARGFHWSSVVALSSIPIVALFLFLAGSFRKNDADVPVGHVRVNFKLPHVMMLVIFCTYVAGESLTSMWMVAYLVEFRKVPLESASFYLSGFFLTMGLTRLSCFASLSKGAEGALIASCLVLSMVSFAAGHFGWLWGFSLAGVLGPFFPLFLGKVSRHFGAEAKPLTVWMLTVVQLTLAVFHLTMGKVTDVLGPRTAYCIPGFLIGITLLLLPLFERARRGHSLGTAFRAIPPGHGSC